MILWDVTKLAKLYNSPFKRLASLLIFFRGCELPRDVKIGKNVIFPHNAIGSVIHSKTVIEDGVRIFQGVTIGKADIYVNNDAIGGFVIRQGAILYSGAKVLCKEGSTIVVGYKSIVAANAVLNQSTGAYEIWGGVPAKRIGYNLHGIKEDGLTVEEIKKWENERKTE